MATFVLLHGGWAGGWVWSGVARELRRLGHEVAAPTLTGFGERSHLLSRDVSLGTLLDDVLGVLRFRELRDVVLVAHSLNGPLAQGVAARRPDLLARLVLLDAFLIRDGERTVDAFDPAFTAGVQAWVEGAGEGWFVPALEPAPDSVDAREGRGRHTAMPWRPYLEALSLSGAASVPGTFVLCTGKTDSPADAAIVASAQRARQDGWEVVEFPADHVPMWTRPGELAQLLAGLAARSP